MLTTKTAYDFCLLESIDHFSIKDVTLSVFALPSGKKWMLVEEKTVNYLKKPQQPDKTKCLHIQILIQVLSLNMNLDDKSSKIFLHVD